MSKTIAAIATPHTAGGIGIVRISGPDAFLIAQKVFRSKTGKELSSLRGYCAMLGNIYYEDTLIDEAVALVFRAPKSYTGEDVVELSCHGGMFVTQKVLRAVLSAGAIPAEAGEFTKRAFLNGKIDLTKAEAVMTLISAQGEQAVNASATALNGALNQKVEGIAQTLISSSAGLAAWVDYPDEEIEELTDDNLLLSLNEAKTTLSELLSTFDAGQAVFEGITAVIAGSPNVGKSTLMNMLSGNERSIVTEYSGTTRDIIEETIRVGDVVLRLADTAGIHDADNPVEKIGIDKAYDKLKTADLVIAVIDGSRPLSDSDINVLKECKNRRTIAVINKTDLNLVADTAVISQYVDHIVYTSAKKGEGHKELADIISALFGTDQLDTSSAILINERQHRCCQQALNCINETIDTLKNGLTLDAVNVSIDSAIEPLLELTGKSVSEAVVDEIFSKFCVGK